MLNRQINRLKSKLSLWLDPIFQYAVEAGNPCADMALQ